MKPLKKIIFFTGSGISQESGISTFRDNDGLWEQYPVETVASIYGWEMNPVYVNNFYKMLRKKYQDVEPNQAHKDILNIPVEDPEIIIITQNVDNLHEQAINDSGKKAKVIHLHGELMTMCPESERILLSKSNEDNKENKKYHLELPYKGEYGLPEEATVGDIFTITGEPGKIQVKDTQENFDKIKDSLMRPYIVFFGEDVPNMKRAIEEVKDCDMCVIIGTSLQVYPAAGLIEHIPYGTPIVYIDPNPHKTDWSDIKVIKKKATEGMKELLDNWDEYSKPILDRYCPNNENEF